MSHNNITLAQLKADAQADCPARKRLAYLFDDGDFTELDAYVKDGEQFAEVICAFGYVQGNPVYAFSQNIQIKNGAMTAASSKKIAKVYHLAAETGVPVIGIYDSFGADVANPMEALKAYGELLLCTSNLSGVVPQIAVVAGVCAGCAAMMAQSADFTVMCKDAQMFCTPNCEGDSAEIAQKNGTAAVVCEDDKSAVEAAAEILNKLPQNNLSPVPMYEYEEPTAVFENNAQAIAQAVCDKDSVTQIGEGYGKSAYTALASIGGACVGIAATNNSEGKLTAQDCSKLARFVRTCDAFAVPIVTFVDTQGFEGGEMCEQQGAVKDITKLAHAYAEATTIKIAVVTGKAYGPAYMALAGKGSGSDLTYALQEAVISPLDPITAVEFMEHDKLKGVEDLSSARENLAQEYIKENASGVVAAQSGCVDGLIEKEKIRQTLMTSIEIMAGKRISRLPKKHSNIQL